MGDVTWQQAEDAMTAAFEYLRAMPDRERGFLAAGSRSCWPAIVRDLQADYADVEAVPSAQLTRRMMAHLGAMLLNGDAAALAVPEAHRALVGRVVVLKRWPGPDGFGWDVVWKGEDRRSRRAGLGRLTLTSDALRKRYERAIGRVAVRMERMGLGFAG